MITEDYVSFQVSKLLKDKGFNEYCRAFWKDWNNKIILCDATRSHVFDFCNNQMLEKEFCSCDETNIAAPTLQIACKWLREVHNIFISIVFCTYPVEKRVTWTPEISTFNSVFPESAIEYNSYEQASEAAIKYCLENLI